MAPNLEIAIPSTSIAHNGGKPYTVYTISVRLPLRSYTVQKRYSDFVTLHTSLTETVGTAPPGTLPSKSWFKSTVSSPDLTESRRASLESYLQAINAHEDSRWRNTPVWRAFLNLPTTFSSTPSRSSTLHSVLTAPGKEAPIADPTIWLDHHRDLKNQLHNARLSLTTRDQATTPQAQHEASANAKSSLVKAGGLISALDEGLTHFSKTSSMGAGEIRRRKDLLSAARRDREALESLLNAMVQKARLDTTVASVAAQEALLNTSTSGSNTPARSSSGGPPKTGRVLGRETQETRTLDNQGLLQLQQQKLQDQDMDVDELRKIIQRQRELGVKINEELEVQNEMLKMVDEDVDRVKGKIDVAKRRVGKIS